jgi:ribosomal protein L40E
MRAGFSTKSRREIKMVYCSKCGTLNPDDAAVCSKCGAPLQAPTGQEQYGAYWRHRHYEGDYYQHYRGGRGIGAFIFGVIIIFIGLSFLLSELYNITFPWWPAIIIILGLWLLYIGFRRSRRNQPRQQ